MARSEQSMNARDDPFSLTVDQYGRLWLHTKQDGIEFSIDLAEKDLAFEIMTAAMLDAGFEHQPQPTAHDGEADNDDQASSS